MNPSDYILFSFCDEDRPGDGAIYRTMDTWAVEREIAYFLYGVVLLLKPNIVLESGTGSGLSAAFMACALQENGFGKLITYEPQETRIEGLRKKLDGLPVEVVCGHLLSYTGEKPGFVFLDSDSNWRPDEVDKYGNLDIPLAVHDANRYPGLERGTFIHTFRGFWFRL